MNLPRFLLPRWRRLADEADECLADGVRVGHPGFAALSFLTAALKYERAASLCPRMYRYAFQDWSNQCASRAVEESEAYRCGFKPDRAQLAPLPSTSPTQPKPKERV